MNEPSSQTSLPDPEQWLQRRRTGLWKWALTALLMLLLQLAFITWFSLNFSYLSGCWEIMLTMEGSALKIAPTQRLSLMMPIWIGLGWLAYSFAMVAIVRFWRLERRYLRMLQRPPGTG